MKYSMLTTSNEIETAVYDVRRALPKGIFHQKVSCILLSIFTSFSQLKKDCVGLLKHANNCWRRIQNMMKSTYCVRGCNHYSNHYRNYYSSKVMTTGALCVRSLQSWTKRKKKMLFSTTSSTLFYCLTMKEWKSFPHIFHLFSHNADPKLDLKRFVLSNCPKSLKKKY